MLEILVEKKDEKEVYGVLGERMRFILNGVVRTPHSRYLTKMTPV